MSRLTIALADPGLLHPVRLRSAEHQKMINLHEMRNLLVKQRTGIVVQLRSVAKSMGFRIPKCQAASFHNLDRKTWPKEFRDIAWPMMKGLEQLAVTIKTYEKQIREFAETPTFKAKVERLMEIRWKYHFATIRQSFSSVGSVSAANRYFSVNNKSLRMALDSLADRSVAGEVITLSDVEAAICAYAVEHPDAICIASVTGYQKQYLTGEWPTVITLKALKGKDTITIVVK